MISPFPCGLPENSAGWLRTGGASSATLSMAKKPVTDDTIESRMPPGADDLGAAGGGPKLVLRAYACIGGAGEGERGAPVGGPPPARVAKSFDHLSGSALGTATLPSITRPASLRTAMKAVSAQASP